MRNFKEKTDLRVYRAKTKMNRLTGKVVLITGASSGIGQACAHEYAKHGSHLILCARRTAKLDGLKQQFSIEFPNVQVHPVTLDVRNRADVFKAISELPVNFKNIDVLVNNAGLVIGVDKVETVSPEAVDTMFDTNVKVKHV
jgi:NADP-dependent 3-hydroxy acid dehydrogenase YdfG